MVPKFLQRFAKQQNLDESTVTKIVSYAEHLFEWNKKFNLTAKKTVTEILSDLCQESLHFLNYVERTKLTCIADIGSGSGILGLVIKIICPEIKVILIEVSAKKRSFLNHIIETLGLNNIEISDIDWRTFTRKTEFTIDCFVTRATFDDPEIIRMFRETSNYKDIFLVYWASEKWTPTEHSAKFVQQVFEYKCGEKKRKMVFFAKNLETVSKFFKS